MANLRPLRLLAQLLMVVGISSNSVTAVIYLKNRSLRKPINFFLIALAFSDLSTMLTNLCQPFIWKRFQSQFGCDLMSALMTMQTHFSLNCFAATAVIRYINIIHPAFSKRIMKWKTCFLLVALLWLEDVVTLWPIFTDFTENTYYEPLMLCSLNSASNWPYYLSLSAIIVTVPNIIVIYCYVSILIKRLQSKRQIRAHNSTNISSTGQESSTWNKKDLRLFRQVIFLFIAFTVCWTPLSVVALTMDFQSLEYQLLFESLLIICYVNFSINPFIYMYFNLEFRKEIVRTFHCKKEDIATEASLTDNSLNQRQRNDRSTRMTTCTKI